MDDNLLDPSNSAHGCKMKTLAAVLLASLALSASAHPFDSVTVPLNSDCPAGTAPTAVAYVWHNGHSERAGWKCESIYRDE
jgi:hypothetical protein